MYWSPINQNPFIKSLLQFYNGNVKKFPTDNSVGYWICAVYVNTSSYNNKFLLFFNAFYSFQYHPSYSIATMFPILLNNLITHLFNVRKIFRSLLLLNFDPNLQFDVLKCKHHRFCVVLWGQKMHFSFSWYSVRLA